MGYDDPQLGRGHIRIGVQISPRFLAGDRMLGKDGTDLDFMRLGCAIGLPALAALQLLMSQRGAGPIGGDIDPWRLLFPKGNRPLPALGRW